MPARRQSYLTIIDRYMLREFITNLAAVTSILLLIYIATRFARYLAKAAAGSLPTEVIFTLLGYSSLGALVLLLPMGAFLAVMLALGRMNSDNELVVISACGISDKRIMRNVLLFSCSIATIVAVLALYIIPSVLASNNIVEQQAKLVAETSGLIAGTFKESSKGDWVIYAERLSEDRGGMENIFIQITRGDKPLVLRADRGKMKHDSETGNQYLILEDGYRYEGEAGEKDFTIAGFASHQVLIKEGGKSHVKERHKALPTGTLWQRGQPKDLAEIEWRISESILTVVLCLLAIPLAQVGPRKGRYAGFVPAVLIYIIYSNLLGVTQAWVAKGALSIWIGAFWVHGLMLLVLFTLVNRKKIGAYWRSRQPRMAKS